MVEKCTPEQRIELVAAAKVATDSASLHGCYFKLLDNLGDASIVEPNAMKQDMTNVVGKIVYTERFASLGLACFNNLYRKLSWYGPEYVRVVLKGSTAIALQRDDFDFGDVDIGIYINPSLPKAHFDKIFTEVSIVCGQVIAKHKQMLDRTFFRPREGHDVLLGEEDKYIFKDLHIKAMEKIGVSSCFSARNESSSNSIYITRSDALDDKVVRINMPHYERAEKIPLEYTPIFCSINDTIKQKKKDGRVTDFSLFRIKWGNCKCISSDTASESSSTSGGEKHTRMASDFIDITVLKQEDSSLIDFLERDGFSARSPLTCLINKWGWRVTCSSITECIHDIHKSLLVYDMSEEKKERKQAMLKILVCK